MNDMEQIFKNKVILVTGSTFRIGNSTAIAFAKRGAKLVLSDWVDVQDTRSIILEAGSEAIFVKCDVSNEDDVRKLIDATIKHYGRLDFALNNAGIEGA